MGAREKRKGEFSRGWEMLEGIQCLTHLQVNPCDQTGMMDEKVLPLVFKNVIWTISSLLNAASSMKCNKNRQPWYLNNNVPKAGLWVSVFSLKKRKGGGGLKSPFGGFPGGQW